MWLHRDEEAERIERRHYRLPCRESLHPSERLRRVSHNVRRLIQDRRRWQVVSQPNLAVVRIVRWRHLHRASAELLVNKVVAKDRDGAVNKRNDHALADQLRVAWIAWVHRDGAVPEQRLRSCGGDNDPFTRCATLQRVTDLPDLPALLYGDRLKVRDARLAARAPVDQRLGAVRQTTLIERGECGAHGAA